MVEVLTVDDQAVFRAAAREVIEATPGFHLAGEASSGEEALRVAAEVEPHLVLLDVRMPGMDGIETAGRLRADHPGSVVVLVTLAASADLPSSVGFCGAAALVRKQDFGPTVLRRVWSEHGDLR